MNASQKEYVNRINKVVDYIERNLNGELNLVTLSSIAHFSPFHFHRIFTLITGETLNTFIKRLRLEKSAHFLINDDEMTISDIAFTCGFNSTPVFCRSFKAYFNESAGDFRKQRRKKLSKIYQTDRKDGQVSETSIAYFSNHDQLKKWRLMMKNKNIEVKQMSALDLVYCRHVGQFDRISLAYDKLFRWAGPRGLLRFPETKTVTVYHDDPNITDIEKLRQSACITVNEEVKTEGEIGNMHLDGGKFIVGSFEISAMEFGDAWNAVCLWMAEKGYQPRDAYPYELYHNDHNEHPERKFILDICMPVKEL